MHHDLELGYLGIEVPDPTTLTSFFGEVIGLVPGQPVDTEGTLTWRNDDRAQRIIVQPGPSQRCPLRRLRGGRRERLRPGHRPIARRRP